MRVKSKPNKKSYLGSRKEVNYIKPVIIILVIIILIAALYVGMRVVSIKNSDEFSMDELAIYYIVSKNTTNDSSMNGNNQVFNKLVIINGEKKVAHVINIPPQLFIFSKNIDAMNSNPRDFAVIFGETLGIKANYIYSIVLKREYLKKTGIKNADELIKNFGKRGLRLTDYFKLRSQVESLRPESVITEASLAKLYAGLGKFNITQHEVQTLTKFPLKITVGGKTFVRIYADEEKFKELKNELEK